jgi:hypothetical protein
VPLRPVHAVWTPHDATDGPAPASASADQVPTEGLPKDDHLVVDGVGVTACGVPLSGLLRVGSWAAVPMVLKCPQCRVRTASLVPQSPSGAS